MFKSKEQKAQEAQADLDRQAASVSDAAVAAARAAKEAGRSVFQYMDVVSTIKGAVVPLIGAFATDEQGITKGKLGQAAGRRVLVSPIESIESAGWRLVDTGYVYQQTHAESRDKFLASGQQEAYSGRILGIYTFRVIDDKPST